MEGVWREQVILGFLLDLFRDRDDEQKPKLVVLIAAAAAGDGEAMVLYVGKVGEVSAN